MKYSIITATLLFKVDARDCFGFALNDAINSMLLIKLRIKNEKNIMARY